MIRVTLYTHDGERGARGEGVTLGDACEAVRRKLIAADPELKAVIPAPVEWTPESLRYWARIYLDGGLALISEHPDSGIRKHPSP